MWRWLLLRAMAAERRPLSALLLPGWLGTQDSEAARQGAMFVFCVHLANGVVLAAALLFLALGFPGTALNVLGTVVVHLALLALFFRSRRALLVSHLLVLVFFVEVNWDFGPDGGFGFLGVVVIPLVAITLLGVRWGLVWTAFCVVWCAWLVPYHFFPHTYAAVVPGASAVLSAVIGIGAAVIELTRARASQDAGASLARQRQAESTMQRFLGTAFPAHAYASNGLLTSVSPGVEALLGVTADHLLGTPLRDLLPDQDQANVDALVQSSTAREFRAELPLKRGDGQWAWVEIFGVPIRSDSLSGETAQAAEDWLFVARDIGEERQARERLARAQRLEGISILAAGLAHDFNNLLVVINGYADLLPESAEKAAILQASGEAASLTSSLMTFGRRLEPASGSTDLCAAIEKWRPMISRVLGARRELNVILPSRPVRCRLGDGQFNQIILNLVTNARQAMEEGGSLTIVVDVLESPPENALVRGLAPGVYGRLTVRDTGRGMDAEVLANALDPFFTTHSSEGGSGVGLASVNAIVHDCGGSLDLDSVPGNGTRVVVYLPLAASAADGSGTESVGAGTSAHAALPVTSESSEPG